MGRLLPQCDRRGERAGDRVLCSDRTVCTVASDPRHLVAPRGWRQCIHPAASLRRAQSPANAQLFPDFAPHLRNPVPRQVVDIHSKNRTGAPKEGLRWCGHCVCYVTAGPRTKHCHECRKCVQGFDHHCVYLQSCVGSANYRPFFTLLMLMTIWTNSLIAINVALLASEGDSFDSCGSRDSIPRLVLVIIHGLVALCCLVLVSGLFCLHVYLCFTRQTTYELVVSRRAAPRIRAGHPRGVRREEGGGQGGGWQGRTHVCTRPPRTISRPESHCPHASTTRARPPCRPGGSGCARRRPRARPARCSPSSHHGCGQAPPMSSAGSAPAPARASCASSRSLSHARTTSPSSPTCSRQQTQPRRSSRCQLPKAAAVAVRNSLV